MQGISGNGMDKATKQYRQYIFKVNHKLARKPTKQGQPQDKGNMKVKGMLRAASKVHLPHLSQPPRFKPFLSLLAGAIWSQAY